MNYQQATLFEIIRSFEPTRMKLTYKNEIKALPPVVIYSSRAVGGGILPFKTKNYK